MFRKPYGQNVAVCDDCCKRVMELLEGDDIAACVNGLIQRTRDSDQHTVAFALENLEHPDQWMTDLELRIGDSLGFNRRQAKKMIAEAKRSLQRAKSKNPKATVGLDAADLLSILKDFQEDSVGARTSTDAGDLEETHSSKKVQRNWRKRPSPRARSTQQLFIVGSIVANGKYSTVFPHSYAIALGLALSAR